MNRTATHQELLPLQIAEPAPQSELPVLAQATATEQSPLPTLKVAEPAEVAAELPPLPVKPPEHSTDPAPAKPSALKPAIKISSGAVVKEQVRHAAKKTLAKAPAVKDKLSTLELKERGSRLKESALGKAALVSSSVKLAPEKLRNLDDRAITRGKATKANLVEKKASLKAPAVKDILSTLRLKERGSNLKESALGKAALVSSGVKLAPEKLRNLDDRAITRGKAMKANLVEKKASLKARDTAKLRETISNAPYLAVPLVVKVMDSLSEVLYQRKGVLAKAIGVIAVSGIAYAAYESIDLSGSVPDIQAGDVNSLTDPIATINDSPSLIDLPIDPTESVVPTEQTTALAEQAPTNGDLVNVPDGGGFTHLIDVVADAQGADFNGSELYDIYQDLDAQLDGNLITGDTYRMPNGDLGISKPGQFQWHLEAQRALDLLIEAKKKKKGLS